VFIQEATILLLRQKAENNLLREDCFRQLLKILVALRRLDVCNEDNAIQPVGE
jgi:hypothetical protein